jgi:hypothetical protein
MRSHFTNPDEMTIHKNGLRFFSQSSNESKYRRGKQTGAWQERLVLGGESGGIVLINPKNGQLHCIFSVDCYIGGLMVFPREGLRGANCIRFTSQTRLGNVT